MNKGRSCWVAVNKNGFINMFVDEPTRNETTGSWEGMLYLDSVVYKVVASIVKTAKMDWYDVPKYLEFGKGE